MASAPAVPSTEQKVYSGIQDYFALQQGREFVNECFKRMEDYRSYIERSGRLSTWKRCYKN